jgi:hypothetical protein
MKVALVRLRRRRVPGFQDAVPVVLCSLLLASAGSFASPVLQVPDGASSAGESEASSPSHGTDLFQNFRNPPPGYGEVAFYWWLGDTLTHERILWELDQLAGKGVTGLQVNYAHSDSGGLIWGLTYPSRPKLFSEQWWNLFGWFMREAKKRGIAVSLSDYTLGIGQGACFDEALAEHPGLAGSELRFAKRYVTGPATVTWHLPGKPLALTAFKVGNDSLPDPSTKTDLAASAKEGELAWTPPEGTWMISCVWAERIMPSYDPMHPLSGKAYIDKFFGRFAEKFPGEPGKGINYFFSDELSFRLQYPIWDEAFAREFLRRKGYDIRPHLAGLFLDAGTETPKIRLDYNDVMVSLCEEHFFQPIYQWHQERGMTMGCDHGGRGRDVAEFGDYFRTQRWLQGPGCDQPKLAQDIIKDKVASSISHLYRRPRVWLEGFHSSGWGTSSAEIADAVFGNFVMGQNLLTFHGLYYSTHGGWWEWAPPCNHFRMPYYQHFGPFMHTVQRLSYVLSRGFHRCDVAILYPVEPVITGTSGEEAVKAAFDAGTVLYNAGIDFDFIDYESLARARVNDGRITVSGEEYRVLIIPSMKTIRFASLAKVRDLVASGGTVVNIGAFPEASERGRGNKDFSSLCSGLFGNAASAQEALGLLRSGRRGGAVYESNNNDTLCQLVSRLFPRDFAVVSSGEGAKKVLPRVMHRHIGTTDLYAVYNLAAGTDCFFRANGKVELWNPSTGERSPLYLVRRSKEGTTVRLPLSQYEVQLIVFTPGENDIVVENSTLSGIDSVTLRGGTPTLFGESSAPGAMYASVRYKGKVVGLEGEAVAGRISKPLPGVWDFEVKPVLDNQWGDFHWPPTPTLIGPEVRRLAYTRDGSLKAYAGDTVSCSFGVQFWKLGPLPEMIPPDTLLKRGTIDLQVPVSLGGKSYAWHPYTFSWRWGVEDDPGHQGYHGLKEEVHDEFIRLGKPVQAWQGAPTVERQAEEGGNFYCLFTGVLSPAEGTYEVHQGAVRPLAIRLNGMPIDTVARTVQLRAGLNTLMLWYNRPCTTYFVLQKPGGTGGIRPGVTPEDPEAKPLAMRWYGDPTVLKFDARLGEKAPEGWYTFLSAPGMKRMRFAVHGNVEVLVGGKRVRVTKGSERTDGATACDVDLEETATAPVEVVFHIAQERGYYGGSAIPDPVQLECLRGTYETGDWSRNDALYAYSGGAKYSRSVSLTPEETTRKIELNLGSVISSAEVWVNGKNAGVKTAPPWVYDISRLVRAGDNSIEVLVYNTAANHYTSIPTRYRGSITSGLLGPVTLDLTERVVLKQHPRSSHNSKQGKR